MRHSVFSLLALGSMVAGMVHAQDAATTITFTGIVTDQTCKIGIDGNNDGNVTVKMKPVKLEEFKKKGDHAGITPFKLSVVDCKSKGILNGVTIDFKKTSNVNADGYIENTADNNPAAGIALRLSEDGQGVNKLDPRTWTGNLELPKYGLSDHSFSAAYVRTEEKETDVTAGNVKAIATVEMFYH